jgi:hypothetical protein
MDRADRSPGLRHCAAVAPSVRVILSFLQRDHRRRLVVIALSSCSPSLPAGRFPVINYYGRL